MRRNCGKKKLREGYSRRQFLSYLGVAGAFYTVNNPLRTFFNGLSDGLIATAQAQVAAQARNYVCVLYPGAPTRWVWDNFLTPNGPADPFIRNRALNNWITEDRYSADNSKATYRSERVDLPNGKIIYLPPLWNADIPVVGGGMVKMKDLLSNTMIIRGVHMQVDIGHAFGPSKVTRPVSTGPSLTGLAADAAPSSVPIQAVATSAFNNNLGDPTTARTYQSETGVGITLVRGMRDPIANIMGSFQNRDPQVIANLSKMNSLSPLIKAALDDLALYAKSSKPGADVLFRTRDNAEALFKKSFGDLTTVYNQLYNKYLDLETRSASVPIPNVIPTTGIAPYDLKSNLYFTGLAGQFAVAEFLLKNGLSSSITIGGENPRIGNIANFNDEHRQSDRQASLICHSFQFRALAAMLYEFRRSLGPQLWEQTVVEVSAEFDRSPSDDMIGSDHAPEANTMTLMSGAIKQPMFMGNVSVQGRGGQYVGTYGKAAPVRTDFSAATIITNEHVATTVADLIGIKSPVRAPSLIKVGSSGVQSLMEDPKNIA